ncbi:MAG: RIP metalloprotease RseP [Bacteroidetes bacterium]|nr:MAG: RIP metalloprotease RseP [Bacteroidota bacterium]PTM13724.1 MAG: RIP metalloprotease RseP [Bacteroidota bacterium]
MDILVMAGQLMLSLSILIVLHEGGHFLPARFFGTRVEKFYLFFDPGFSLFKKKIGETEYGIGWLPLGGYVKISGMIDESFDSEQMQGEPQEWEFRSKPAWQRLIIMMGGVTVNFFLGLLIFAGVLWYYGQSYLPTENVKYGIAVDSIGYEIGLREGDNILAINGQAFDKFNSRTLLREIVINNANTIEVRRAGENMDIPIDNRFVGVLSSYENKGISLFMPRVPFVAAKFSADSPAKTAGMEVKDSIIALNGTPTPFFTDFVTAIAPYKGQEVTVTVSRNGVARDLTLTTTDEAKIGVYPADPTYFFPTKRQEYSLAQAIPAGAALGWGTLTDQLKAFGQMFRGKIKASESLGGFASIGGMFGNEWVWERFWTMTAILSLILAFMNLLPIPALDGGHVMFLLYEAVSGRKPSDKFMEYATLAGFVVVIGLVIFANGLDIKRIFFGG